MGGTTYFYPTSAENSRTSNDTINSVANSSISSGYQVYPGTPSHVLSIKARGGSYFINDDIRMDILNRNALTLMHPDPEQFAGKKMLFNRKTSLIFIQSGYFFKSK